MLRFEPPMPSRPCHTAVVPRTRLGAIFVALSLITAGCGPSAAPAAAPSASAVAPPSPPGPPPRTVRFALAFDGRPAGNEVWNITDGADGSQTIDFESVVETPRGKVGGKGRYSITAAHLPEAAEVA